VVRKLAVIRRPGPGWVGAVILHTDSIVSLSRRTLDSLTSETVLTSQRADSALAGAAEAEADSLGAWADAARARAATMRDVGIAAARSATHAGADSIIRFERIRLRVRWGGPRVGPEPVDREYVLHLLKSGPMGDWIVFSLRPRGRETARIPL